MKEKTKGLKALRSGGTRRDEWNRPNGKQQERLAKRVADYEKMITKGKGNYSGYKKPGSQKK